jgi:hypothetical protein
VVKGLPRLTEEAREQLQHSVAVHHRQWIVGGQRHRYTAWQSEKQA